MWTPIPFFATVFAGISNLLYRCPLLMISWDYVGWRIEANRECREAVDYDDYGQYYVH
jgi:hypothetical protein